MKGSIFDIYYEHTKYSKWNASRCDALEGVADDCLIRYTIVQKAEKRPQAPKRQIRPQALKEVKRNSLETGYGTYGDKKTMAHKCDQAAKTNPEGTKYSRESNAERHVFKTYEHNRHKRGLNRALHQWGHPRDGTTCRLGTCVPSGHGVLSGGFLGPCQVVVSGALRALKG